MRCINLCWHWHWHSTARDGVPGCQPVTTTTRIKPCFITDDCKAMQKLKLVEERRLRRFGHVSRMLCEANTAKRMPGRPEDRGKLDRHRIKTRQKAYWHVPGGSTRDWRRYVAESSSREEPRNNDQAMAARRLDDDDDDVMMMMMFCI